MAEFPLLSVAPSLATTTKLGHQRTWYWRGWRVHYTYVRATQPQSGAPPLLLVHGFGAAVGHWRFNLEALSQHHSVYAIDLLGFGASQKASTLYSPLLWAEQIHEFWRSLIGVPVVLVGNSLGSVVCMMAAARFPEMVRAIAWINLPDASVLTPAMPSSLTRLKPLLTLPLRPLISLAKWLFTSPLVINPLLWYLRPPRRLHRFAKGAYQNTQVVDDQLVEILSAPAYERGASQALRAMTRYVGLVPDRYRARSVLPQLQIPLLLLWGKCDRFVPPSLAPRVAALNPRIRLVELEAVGHCPHDEVPDQVNPLLLDWLSAEGLGPRN